MTAFDRLLTGRASPRERNAFWYSLHQHHLADNPGMTDADCDGKCCRGGRRWTRPVRKSKHWAPLDF